MLPRVSRQYTPIAGKGKSVVRVTRLRHIRNYAVESSGAPAGESAPFIHTAPKKKGRFVRRTLLFTTALTTGFYAGSTLVAFNNERYHDFFSESVPLGEKIIEFGESQGWDRVALTGPAKQAYDLGRDTYNKVEGAVTRTFGSDTPEAKPSHKFGQAAPPGSFKEKANAKKEQLRNVASTIVTKVEKNAENAPHTPKEAAIAVKNEFIAFSEGVADLVKEAEAALAGKPFSPSTSPAPVVLPDTQPSRGVEFVEAPKEFSSDGQKVYNAPLPLGFQPPPGYVLPSKPKASTAPKEPKADAAPSPLPLVAPTVAKFSASEPVIAQLAETIDSLAAYLRDNPSAASGGAKDVLLTAEIDLKQLADRMEKVKEDERKKLEVQLDEQSKDYSRKMLDLEADAQDKMDRQEEDWKTLFDEERQKISTAYRKKLESELATQSEIIDQRLKEEVVAQGIELQRRWIREIKVRVEKERAGRLAKLEDLATDVKRLERVTLDNSTFIDENVNIHALWSSIRALHAAITSPTRRPFREELRVLQHVAAARADPVLSAAISTIESSDAPDVGVEPLADLTTWFTTGVAPKVESTSLVPDQGAGVLSHIASIVFSKFKFKRSGLVDGSDVSSVLARAEYYMNEKDLDSAARELNQLGGWSKVLLNDWLAAARRRLEVEQALEVVQTQATLASLLVL